MNEIKSKPLICGEGEKMNIGEILKYYRMTYNMTQSKVAELSGINEKYLGRIERNESVPTIDKIEQLCTAFDIRVIDFFMPPIHSKKSSTHNNVLTKNSVKNYIYYCNCCGEEFISKHNDVICPNCLCLYDEDNGYIEKYAIYCET